MGEEEQKVGKVEEAGPWPLEGKKEKGSVSKKKADH